ncbi:MAG: type IV secretory system conjugative DNA transfer family protein [Acidimicrobiales bacterium]
MSVPASLHAPAGVYLALAALTVAMFLTGSGTRTGRRRPVPAPRRSSSARPKCRPRARVRPAVPATARWATRSDLAPLRQRRPEAGRLVLGRAKGVLLATESRHSVLVIGPTQSGKTTGLAIPAILEWAGPVLATSVKDDLARGSLAWRRGLGRCWIFDPTGTSGLRGASTWSPLVETTTWSAAQRMASWLVESTPNRSSLSDGAFWLAAAAKLLAPLLLAARLSGATMADVVRWNNQSDLGQAGAILEDFEEEGAAVALEACASRDERLRSSISTTLETVLAPFEDPAVGAATSGAEIDVRALLSGENTLYLCGPSHEQARVQGLFATLVSTVVAAAVERSAYAGGPLQPPLLVVLDEAANIAPLRDLDTLASTAAGHGIQLVTVCQDLSQLGARYGEARARAVANNHRAKVVLSGVGDLTTLELISGLAGEVAQREESVTSDLRDGRRTRTTGVAHRRLAPAAGLRGIRPGEGLLLYGHLPAARLALRPWYSDRELRRRVEGCRL